MEKRPGYEKDTFVRPYAIRAASGHRSIDILDPNRIAAKVPTGISSYVSGIFHIAEVGNLLSIFQTGLCPGGMKRKKRMDVHFMAFFPTHPWNTSAVKKLKSKRFQSIIEAGGIVNMPYGVLGRRRSFMHLQRLLAD